MAQNIFINDSYPPPDPILKCLAAEEERWHKIKKTNAQYFLNQNVLNTVSELQYLKFKSRFTTEICQHPNFRPSLALVYLVLRYKDELFEFSGDQLTQMAEINQLEQMQTEFQTQLISYLAMIHAELPMPNRELLAQSIKYSNSSSKFHSIPIGQVDYGLPCLERYIPSMRKVLERHLYLQEEVDPNRLFGTNKELNSLFENLKNLDWIKKQCKKFVLKSPSSSTQDKTEKAKSL